MTQVADMFLDSTTVAETDMVIVVQKGNPKGIKTLADLTAEGLAVGVANPKQSALGALTQRMLEASNLYEKVEKNVKVKTPTADLLVNQIRTGSLDAVIVYRANTPYVRDDLDILSIDHPAAKAVQPYAVSKDSPHRYLMERLLDSIQSEESRQIFEEIGFRLQGVGGGSS
jgi:molybdate transport system substrate-binding protein